MLTSSPSPSVTVYTANQHIIPWCQTTDRHDNAAACKSICDTTADIHFTFPGTSMAIRWVPGSASFSPLKRLQEIALDAATAADPTHHPAAKSIAALREDARRQVLSDWEQVWLKDPRRDPAYRAVQHPPSGQPPEFMLGIAGFARPIFCTAIRLLTEHAFTGEYNARHRPRAPDPHGCQCGQAALQTPTHIIADCPLHRATRNLWLRPLSLYSARRWGVLPSQTSSKRRRPVSGPGDSPPPPRRLRLSASGDRPHHH